MFITLTASFRDEDQPDFEGMGIIPRGEDFEDSVWEDLYVHIDHITTMNINDAGTTNIYLINGEKWSVKESPQEIARMCKEKGNEVNNHK